MSSSTYDRSNGLTGWSMFSAIWLVVAGAFNLVEGLTSIHQANNISSAFLFQNLKFWGWVLLIVAIVQLFAGFMVFSGNPTGYMLGVLVASFCHVHVVLFPLHRSPGSHGRCDHQWSRDLRAHDRKRILSRPGSAVACPRGRAAAGPGGVSQPGTALHSFTFG